MPLPLWSDKIFDSIIKFADETIKNSDKFGVLDDYIMKQYSLSAEEINYIKNLNK